MEKKILLASNSPRRKEILTRAGYDISVISANGVELDIVSKPFSDDLVCECAYRKAKNAYENIKNNDIMKNSILVSADTVVVNDGIIYGKPKDREGAIEMLKSLSDKVHEVSTSVCIGYRKDSFDDMIFKVGIEKTKVYFRKLTLSDIEKYLDSGKPYDKAGSYGIQDEGFDFATKIDGNIDNVIGFPMKKFNELLIEIGAV